MATTKLSCNPQKITVSGTSDNEIDFNDVISGEFGTALITLVSGTSIQFNASAPVDGTNSAALQSADNKFVLPIKLGSNIHYKGGAGSEVFSITITK